jgi:hypothetical protein
MSLNHAQDDLAARAAGLAHLVCAARFGERQDRFEVNSPTSTILATAVTVKTCKLRRGY